MSDRERLVKERAYSLWETEGNPDGRHEDHWQQAEREIDDASSPATPSDVPIPPEMDLEPVPLAEQGMEHSVDAPLARTGKSANNKKPVEAADSINPVHHTGEQPADPLAH